jgi:hypothetical protein
MKAFKMIFTDLLSRQRMAKQISNCISSIIDAWEGTDIPGKIQDFNSSHLDVVKWVAVKMTTERERSISCPVLYHDEGDGTQQRM